MPPCIVFTSVVRKVHVANEASHVEVVCIFVMPAPGQMSGAPAGPIDVHVYVTGQWVGVTAKLLNVSDIATPVYA